MSLDSEWIPVLICVAQFVVCITPLFFLKD